jgi:hypothetical protein
VLTYVVTTDRAALLDYCEHARVHPRAARLVQSPAGLLGANLGENRIVFYGEYRRLPQLAAIIDRAQTQILEDVANTAIGALVRH